MYDCFVEWHNGVIEHLTVKPLELIKALEAVNYFNEHYNEFSSLLCYAWIEEINANPS